MKLNFVPPSHDHGWYFKDGQGRVVMAQGQPVPLAVANELAERFQTGWQSWSGCDEPYQYQPYQFGSPVTGSVKIDVELRNGTIWQGIDAGMCCWRHDKTEGDIVAWRVSPLPSSPCPDVQMSDEFMDAFGWHDIDVQPTAPVWPDESRADRDPTAIMGGVVLPPVEGHLPPTLTVAVDAGGCAPLVLVDRPVNVGTMVLVCNSIQLGIAAISAALALVCIGTGFPLAAVFFIASAMYAVRNATT